MKIFMVSRSSLNPTEKKPHRLAIRVVLLKHLSLLSMFGIGLLFSMYMRLFILLMFLLMHGATILFGGHHGSPYTGVSGIRIITRTTVLMLWSIRTGSSQRIVYT